MHNHFKVLNKGDRVILFGVESHFTPDIIDSVERLGANIFATIITDTPQWDLKNLYPLNAKEIPPSFLQENYFIARNNPSGLRKLLLKKSADLGFSKPVTIIDPNAVVSSRANIDNCVYVAANAVIASFVTLSQGTYINRLAGIGHHSSLGEFVSIGPGANICSKVTIGAGTTVGAGASIAPGVQIGSNSVIATGAAVHKDVPSNVIVKGNPAEIVKRSIIGNMGYGV